MTRKDKLIAMSGVLLIEVADRLGVKVACNKSRTALKEAKLNVVERILAAEAQVKEPVEEVIGGKETADLLKSVIKDVEGTKKVVEGAEEPVELEDEVCGDGIPYAEIGKEIAEQAKQKAAAAAKSNRKRGALIEYNGKSQNICAWAKELGVSANTLYGRIYKLGWSVEKAFTK